MLSYLPRYYETSRVIGSVLQAEGTEFDNLREALDSTLDQFFARTATWSLDAWERELGLSPAPAQPIGERRDKVVSRLRGTGTATIRVVKEVAEAYDLGSIDVIEEFTTYTIWIRFVDTLGAPPNLNDLKGAIRAVLPAHLLVEYAFKYFLVGHIHQTITIADLQSRKMTDFAPFIPM
jgi:uncharacterized protein YmfQ (DUF2313 family)